MRYTYIPNLVGGGGWKGHNSSKNCRQKGCTRLAAASDKVYQLLAQGRWFSLVTSASSTTKSGRHYIAEILLKVTLNTHTNYPLKLINVA